MRRSWLRHAVVFFVTLWIVSVAGAQDGGDKAKKTQFYWCWAAQLRRDNNNNEKWYYSDVFSGSWPTSEVNNAFFTHLRRAYSADFMATGIGNGQCGAYPTSSSAEGYRDRDIREKTDEGMQVIATGWNYR